MPATYSYYLYTASDSNVYRVYLLDAIAVAMGFALDTASHPYLPFDVSPRFALGETVAGSAITRLALMAPTASALAPLIGTDITIEGTTYRVIACYGESIGFNPFPGIFGKSGPPGAPGAISMARYYAPPTQTYTPVSGPRIFDFVIPSIGTYLFLGKLVIVGYAPTGPNQIITHVSGGAGAYDFQENFLPNPSSGQLTFNWHEIMTFTSLPSEIYWGFSLTDTLVLYGGDYETGEAYSTLEVLKLS